MTRDLRRTARVVLPVAFAIGIIVLLASAAPLSGGSCAYAATARTTTITGLNTFRDPVTTEAAQTDTITVTPAYGRTVQLMYYDASSGKWVCKATYTLKNAESAKVKVSYPNDWTTAASTTWRIKVPKVAANSAAGTPAMKLCKSADITIHNRSKDPFTATSLKGVDTSMSKAYTKTMTDSVTICPAYGREVCLYIYNENTGNWKKKATFKTANKYSATVKLTYPETWKAHYESKWRVSVPATAPDAAKNLPALPKVKKNVKLYNKVGSMGAGIVMDEKGNVLYDHAIKAKMSPASMTKMMTAILMEENMDPSDKVTIKQAAKDEINDLWGPYYDGYATGEYMTERKALYAMLLPSSNVVAGSSGICISGSTAKFAKLMNTKAKEIGCTATTFKNAHGLEGDGTNNGKGNWSTAYDQALIGRYIMTNSDMSTIRTVVKTSSKKITTSKRTFWVGNTNPVLGEFGNVGIKTGTEIVAGNCFCGAFNYGGKIYITVVMRASSKRYDTIALFNYMKYSVENGIKAY